jgi:hypothetical protein
MIKWTKFYHLKKGENFPLIKHERKVFLLPQRRCKHTKRLNYIVGVLAIVGKKLTVGGNDICTTLKELAWR